MTFEFKRMTFERYDIMANKKGMTRDKRLSARVDNEMYDNLKYHSNLLNITISDVLKVYDIFVNGNADDARVIETYKIAKEMNWL